jgi:hypothetical protein
VQLWPLDAAHPDQPENADPLSGVAVNITVEAFKKGSEQSAPQEIPVPLTVPLPTPVLSIDRT